MQSSGTERNEGTVVRPVFVLWKPAWRLHGHGSGHGSVACSLKRAGAMAEPNAFAKLLAYAEKEIEILKLLRRMTSKNCLLTGKASNKRASDSDRFKHYKMHLALEKICLRRSTGDRTMGKKRLCPRWTGTASGLSELLRRCGEACRRHERVGLLGVALRRGRAIGQQPPQLRTKHARTGLAGARHIYRWPRLYSIPLRQLPPRLVRVLLLFWYIKKYYDILWYSSVIYFQHITINYK